MKLLSFPGACIYYLFQLVIVMKPTPQIISHKSAVQPDSALEQTCSCVFDELMG